MLKIPEYILDSLENDRTSLGKHPAFPPEEEEKFIVNAVADRFTELTENMEITDVEQLKNELGRLIVKCKKIERKSSDALEQLCISIVSELFSIPEDTVKIEANLVDSVNTDNQRMLPEKTPDFSFDSIKDMNLLSKEIYKRRMLNALVTGAAMYYSDNISYYIRDLFEIDDELPSLYKKIVRYNEILIYLEKDTLNKEDNDNITDGGKVDVEIGSLHAMPVIKSEGLIFPVLLNETIKGVLELAISHGLPEKREKAEYVIKKSDFRLAELWDMRLGYVLWEIIAEQIEDMDVIEPNFFLMTLSELPCDKFNDCLGEIFGKTKRGKRILDNIIRKIMYEKERDDFDDFIERGKDGHQIEDGYYTSEELIADSDLHESKKQKKKKKVRKNDEGKTVPEFCDKCGAKVGVYIQGEPIFKCSNKECGKYFGTVPFPD